MQAFSENPELILIVYALMALPVVVGVVLLGFIVVAMVNYRAHRVEKAKKFTKIAGIILGVYIVFELLTRSVL